MISRQTYQRIVCMLEEQSGSEERKVQIVAEHFPNVLRGTLLSIYSQRYQLQMKRIHPLHYTKEAMEKQYNNYTSQAAHKDSPFLLQEMASKLSLSPTLLARIVLEQYIIRNGIAEESGRVSQWMKTPALIPDSRLQQHVKQCVLNDTNYGPLADNIKQSVGCEYELLTKEHLCQLGIPFLDETALRGRGYDKTPDCKLEVPMLVKGFPVNWVESKASFGDDISHGKYLEEQFWSYQNRFGPGLVIYWFGFIKELDTTSSQGILLADSFPPHTLISTPERLYDIV